MFKKRAKKDENDSRCATVGESRKIILSEDLHDGDEGIHAVKRAKFGQDTPPAGVSAEISNKTFHSFGDEDFSGQDQNDAVAKKEENGEKSISSKDDFKIKLPFGPIKVSNYVKVTTRFDYAPDICKDYKETGYCGYGDTCKFLHDRSDYKHGWQIEKEWEVEQRKKSKEMLQKSKVSNSNQISESATDSLNIDKCPICNREFTNKVETKCHHLFCSNCAISRYFIENDKTCFSCGARTDGIFNRSK